MDWSNLKEWDVPFGYNGSIEVLTPDIPCMRATKTQTRLHKRAFLQEHCTKIADKNGQIMIVEEIGK